MKGPVYVIDDDDDVREVTRFSLESEHHEVVEFSSGEEALEAIEKGRFPDPCLIIVDYLMPEMDGITFIKELRKRFPDRARNMPIALNSGVDTFEGLEAPPEDITRLSKPVELDDLLKLVRGHCG